jgi:hypothetical protein
MTENNDGKHLGRKTCIGIRRSIFFDEVKCWILLRDEHLMVLPVPLNVDSKKSWWGALADFLLFFAIRCEQAVMNVYDENRTFVTFYSSVDTGIQASSYWSKLFEAQFLNSYRQLLLKYIGCLLVSINWFQHQTKVTSLPSSRNPSGWFM